MGMYAWHQLGWQSQQCISEQLCNLCMVFEAAEVKAALSCARTLSPRLWPMVPKEIN